MFHGKCEETIADLKIKIEALQKKIEKLDPPAPRSLYIKMHNGESKVLINAEWWWSNGMAVITEVSGHRIWIPLYAIISIEVLSQ